MLLFILTASLNSDVCVCVCVFSHVFAVLWTVALQAHLSLEFSSKEYWSGLPFPTPGDLPDPGVELESSASPALAGGLITNVPYGKLTQNHSSKVQ